MIPDGGSGGNGGNIYLVADKTVHSLSLLRKRHYNGNNGISGAGRSKDGKSGKDIYIQLPLGTLVYEIIRDEAVSKKDLRNNINYKRKLLVDLSTENQKYLICKGGLGGVGNKKSVKNVPNSHNYKSGQPGEEKEVELLLKCVSDVCLIGFPNAGKSSLMAAVRFYKFS